jgi:hypothetical protein
VDGDDDVKNLKPIYEYQPGEEGDDEDFELPSARSVVLTARPDAFEPLPDIEPYAWEEAEQPKEIICPTHKEPGACPKGLCLDYSQLREELRKQERRRLWENRVVKGILFQAGAAQH